jgi:perosamine synthetase
MINIYRKCRNFLGAFFRVPFLVPYWGQREYSALWKHATGMASPYSELIESLDHEAGRFLGTSEASATNLGRSAIELVLRTARIGPGDEVVIPSFSCLGLLQPILKVNAVPVLAEVEADYNLHPGNVRGVLTPRTKCVIVPHLSGLPADVDGIKGELASHGDILLIEDVCQAAGGKTSDGSWLGSQSDWAVYSFGFGKNAMATTGGLVASWKQQVPKVDWPRDTSLATAGRFLKMVYEGRFRRVSFPLRMLWQAATGPQPSNQTDGENYSDPEHYPSRALSSLDAELIAIQLNRLPEIISRRQQNARLLRSLLENIEGLELPPDSGTHIYTKFLVRVECSGQPPSGQRHPDLISFTTYLRRNGVEAEFSYIPLHLREPLRMRTHAPLPYTDSFYSRVCALPVHPGLDHHQIEYAARVVRKWFSLGEADRRL